MTTYNSYVTGSVTNTVIIDGPAYQNPVEVLATGNIMPSTATARIDGYDGIDGFGIGPFTLGNLGNISGGKSYSATGAGGIGVDLTSVTLTNSKNILGGNGYNGSNGGVGVSMAGTLTNTANAVIAGGLAYDGSGTGGVGVLFSGGTLTNAAGAQIEGGGIGFGYRSTPATGNGGGAIDLGAGATVKNFGSIEGGGGPATGSKTHPDVGGYGIQATSSTDVITNEGGGRITGGNGYTTAGAGLLASGAATVVNAASGLIYGGVGEGSGTSGAGVQLSGNASLTNQGKIEGGTASRFGVGGAGVTIASGASVNDQSKIYGGTGFGGNGVGVYLDGGTLTVSGEVSGGSGDTAGIGDSVQFGSAAGRITVESGATFFGHIGGFGLAAGDTVDITTLSTAQVAAAYNATTHSITLNANPGGTLQFDGSFAGEHFLFTPDGNGTDVTVAAACYRRGTRISSGRGAVPIESLTIGDRVLTQSGLKLPIRWIGRRRYSGDFAVANRAVQPVRFHRGSLGDALPARDLWVSPEHAMYLDGLLIPAALLVNGTSIVQERDLEDIEYLHLEFASHAVIFAEGAAAESFVDDASRRLFDNAAEYARLYPGAAPEASRFCAPRVEDGEELEAVRRRLEAIALGGFDDRAVVRVPSNDARESRDR